MKDSRYCWEMVTTNFTLQLLKVKLSFKTSPRHPDELNNRIINEMKESCFKVWNRVRSNHLIFLIMIL